MDCKKCIHCLQVRKDNPSIVCDNKKLMSKLKLLGAYLLIEEPAYCACFKTAKQQKKELNKNRRNKKWKNK